MSDSTDSGSRRQAISLPHFPGENPVLHESVHYWELTQTKLATAGLSKAAEGKMPDKAASYVDTDLNELPVLPIDHRDHERRNEVRLAERKKNHTNRRKRYEITMEQRTAVFASLYESAEKAAPMFARELREACDYSRSGVDGGYFDGPLAYRIVYAKLFKPQRTQADEDFYDTAKTLQKKSALPDGCKASDFMSKAYAWIYKIRPHLAQSYTDEQAARYLIALMPRRLGSDARRIFSEYEKAGLLGNLMQLARELEKIVYTDQSAPLPAPALVQLEVDLCARYDLLALSEMTGIAFVASGAKPAASAGKQASQLMYGVGGKWCSGCDRHKDCFFDPN